MTLGERIQAHRKQSGLSQEKLADMVNVSRQAVTKWEVWQSVPSMDNLIKLSEIFKVPLDQFASGNNIETAPQAIQATTVKRDNAKSIINLSWLSFILIGAANNGYYQDKFFGSNDKVFLWIGLAFVGGILMMIRDLLYYNKHKRSLFGYDLLFAAPVILIPLISIRHDIAMIAMLAYVIAYLIVFYRKIIRPIRPKK